MSKVMLLAGDRVCKLVGELVPHIDSAGAIETVRSSQVVSSLSHSLLVCVDLGNTWKSVNHAQTSSDYLCEAQ